MGRDNDTFENPRTVLKRHGMRPKRSWGQNFLVSEKAIRTVAEQCHLSKNDRALPIVEIGAGVGTLTRALLKLGSPVIAIERDRDMCRILLEEFKEELNFQLIEADAQKVDYAALFQDGRGVLTGNLPYQLTGRLIRTTVNTYRYMTKAVIMVQKEVADRLVAGPGDSARGALSAIVQSRFEVKSVLTLKPTAFYPPPAVRSSVLRFLPKGETFFGEELSEEHFDKVVNAAFSSRRKTVRNSLISSGIGWKPTDVETLLAQSGIDPVARPETLSVEEFSRLAAFSSKKR